MARMPAAARSMAGGSTGGKTPTYKRMRGVVRAFVFSQPLAAVLSFRRLLYELSLAGALCVDALC